MWLVNCPKLYFHYIQITSQMPPQNFQIIVLLFWYILVAIFCFKIQKNCWKKLCKNCFIKQYCYVLANGTKKRKIGNDTTNQQSLFNFFGKTQKKSIEKFEKDSRKFNDNKTPLQTKRTCDGLERMAIDKKQKIEKFHTEPGQSNHQLSRTTVNDTEEPDQSNLQLSSTTVTDTTIEESKNKIYVAFKNIFSDIKTEQIHNYYFCQQKNCLHISSKDLASMSKDNKFQQNSCLTQMWEDQNMEFSLYWRQRYVLFTLSHIWYKAT